VSTLAERLFDKNMPHLFASVAQLVEDWLELFEGYGND